MVSFERRGLFGILLAFGISVSALSQHAHAQNWAEKMFATKSHDFRTVGRGAKSEFHFDFTNLYEEEVHVQSVRTSCGCTSPTVTKDTLKTHQKSSILATFNTNTFIGQKQATITVVFDRPSYAEVQLKVSGFIRTDITFTPPEVAYGEIPAGQASRRGNRDHENGWESMADHRRAKPLQQSAGSAGSTRDLVRHGPLPNARQARRFDVRRRHSRASDLDHE